MRRYVYRGPAEPEARATASGDQNIVSLAGLSMGPISRFPVSYPPRNFAIPAPRSGSAPGQFCPAWGCGGPRYFGPISSVPQPPPSTGVTLTVPDTGLISNSPQPSPTVAAPTTPSLTDPGLTLAQQTGTPLDIGTWLGESTLFSSFPNWAVLGAGAVAAWMLLGGRKR